MGLTRGEGLTRLAPGQSRLRGRSRRHPSLATDLPTSRLSNRITKKPRSASSWHRSGCHHVIGPPRPMTSSSGSSSVSPNVSYASSMPVGSDATDSLTRLMLPTGTSQWRVSLYLAAALRMLGCTTRRRNRRESFTTSSIRRDCLVARSTAARFSRSRSASSLVGGDKVDHFSFGPVSGGPVSGSLTAVILALGGYI